MLAADLPMLMLVITLTALTPALFTLLLAWGGENTGGLKLWAASLLVYAAGFVLLIDRFVPQPWLPGDFTVIVGNACRTVALAGLLWAACIYQGRRPAWWAGWALPALGVLLYALAVHSPALRIGAGNVLLITQLALVIYAVLQKPWRTPGRGVWVVVLGLALALAAFGLRLLALAGGYQVGRYSTTSVLQTLTLVGPLLALMGTTIGFLYMHKERTDETNRRLAVRDPLTGAFNRRALTDALERELHRATRSGQSVALLMVDVDHFKRINDEHGHLMGDQVLRHLVQLVQDRLRAQDLVARFGGEEFVVLAPDTSPQGAMQLAELLRAAAAAHPAQLNGQVVRFSVSVGVAAQVVHASTTWQSLLNQADRALYQAKHGGRDRVFSADDLSLAPDLGRPALST